MEILSFVSCVAAPCFDFSPGLMQLNMIILPLGSPRDFVYDQQKLFFFCSFFLFFSFDLLWSNPEKMSAEDQKCMKLGIIL